MRSRYSLSPSLSLDLSVYLVSAISAGQTGTHHYVHNVRKTWKSFLSTPRTHTRTHITSFIMRKDEGTRRSSKENWNWRLQLSKISTFCYLTWPRHNLQRQTQTEGKTHTHTHTQRVELFV